MITPADDIDICILIGETFTMSLTWQTGLPPLPVNLTGYAVDMQVRASVESPTVIAELSTSNGGITIPNPASGVINFNLTSSQTGALQARYAVFDLQITDSLNEVYSLIDGVIRIQQVATRQ